MPTCHSIPTCHCGGACPRGGGGPQSRERALETVCLFMLDARLIGRFPLMPLAWIPAYAGMTWVKGIWALIMLVRQLNRCLTI